MLTQVIILYFDGALARIFLKVLDALAHMQFHAEALRILGVSGKVLVQF